ncbi:MAG: bifunctional [glutamate--ammonia ligase]-adenylyl-L-tyrosine phosphorylase/[glutamate--ammonia-ligase] adenylyltransferase [Thermodesulfobacteriota bacterium]|nr:bifunctional [glutamate--ammonia ligase]-adenylyl-L-tyrosine phosphorylase/[glutamate--ammonia-ligase] adenylyltransferase [Thermodesulfobacteriota bacterium]
MTSYISLPEELVADGRQKMDALLHAFSEKEIRIALNDRQVDEIKAVFAFSEFICRTVLTHPDILIDLLESGDLASVYDQSAYDTRIGRALSTAEDDDAIGATLRRIRQREMVRIAWRDLCQHADLSETLNDLSRFADACIHHTVARLHTFLANAFGIPLSPDGTPSRLITLGMGKLGAHELNFSSDIDLVFVYPDVGETRTSLADNGGAPFKGPIPNDDFFTRLARRATKILGHITADGFVFRVDLRLRPYGDSGPMVLSIDAMEDYLAAQGREWERYAYIKARAITGHPRDIARLTDILHAFVYRRYLDYASFDALREMKQSIVAEVNRKGVKNNIKIGAGGIREIEFFGQIFQLIRGGVEPMLRERKILTILDLLVTGNHIPGAATLELKEAYAFLRNTEHRLQEYADAQTHTLPEDGTGQLRLATTMGFADWTAFRQALDRHMNRVHYHFTQILGDVETPARADETGRLLKNTWTNLTHPGFEDQAISDLGQAGFESPDRIYRFLDDLKNHPQTRSLSRDGWERVDKLMPVVLKKLLPLDDAETLLGKLVSLVLTVEKRTCYIALLNENPSVIDHLITLARESAWIISYLTRHPVLLDELLDIQALAVPPEKKAIAADLETRLQKISLTDLEDMIIESCIFKQINTLRVAVSDISGAFPLMKVSDYLTDIAEVIIDNVCRVTWAALTKEYGFPSKDGTGTGDNTGFAVIGFGKLGGIELGYGSDLDLVFIHAGDAGQTTGPRSTYNSHFYYRLGQKIIHFLTTRTTAGLLYEVDMRLRPSGDAGMIVSHISSISEYYEKDAWTWEHQALVRARPICGDKALFDRFNAIRKEILCKQRDRATLLAEITDMREKMRAEHGNTDPELFHLKQDGGGIIDIEFLVQYLVLANAHAHPEITQWTDNVRLLETMAGHGIIDVESAGRLKDAYIALRTKIHKLNLQEKPALVPADAFADQRAAVSAIRKKYLVAG